MLRDQIRFAPAASQQLPKAVDKMAGQQRNPGVGRGRTQRHQRGARANAVLQVKSSQRHTGQHHPRCRAEQNQRAQQAAQLREREHETQPGMGAAAHGRGVAGDRINHAQTAQGFDRYELTIGDARPDAFGRPRRDPFHQALAGQLRGPGNRHQQHQCAGEQRADGPWHGSSFQCLRTQTDLHDGKRLAEAGAYRQHHRQPGASTGFAQKRRDAARSLDARSLNVGTPAHCTTIPSSRRISWSAAS